MHYLMTKIFFTILTFNILLAQISLEKTPKSLLFDLNNSIPDIAMPTINEDILWQQDMIENDKFEFQYLYGVPMEKNIKQYKSKNFRVRTYVPFGKDWYDYSIRRIKENPKIASYVLKNIFSKK